MYCLLRAFTASLLRAARTTAEVGFPKQFNAASGRSSLFRGHNRRYPTMESSRSKSTAEEKWETKPRNVVLHLVMHYALPPSPRVPHQGLDKPGYSGRLRSTLGPLRYQLLTVLENLV